MERIIESVEIVEEEIDWMLVNPWSVDWLANALRGQKVRLAQVLSDLRDEAAAHPELQDAEAS